MPVSNPYVGPLPPASGPVNWPASPNMSYNDPSYAGGVRVPLMVPPVGFPGPGQPPRLPAQAMNTGTGPPFDYSKAPMPSPVSQPSTPTAVNKPHQCRFCGKTYMHESTKCRHEKEHWNSYACPEPGCEVVSQRKDSMKRHVRLMHGKSDSGEDDRAGGSGSSRRNRGCKMMLLIAPNTLGYTFFALRS